VRKRLGSLYLRRTLGNADELIAWAKAQGFKTTLPPGDMHVTIAFSKELIEWPKPLQDAVQIERSEDRLVSPLGDGGAVVLKFTSAVLQKRWKELVDAGASWDFDSYQPHVTISWEAGGLDLTKVKPFQGELIFGPEELSEIDEDWRSSVTEKQESFNKAEVFKVDEELGLVFGWGLVSNVNGEAFFDSQGDHIPEGAMLKAAADFMLGGRVAKEMHVGDSKGTILFAWPLTADIAKAMEIETKFTGLMIAMKPHSPEILEKFKSGEYSGFSIGGKRVVDEEIDDG
jgi:hypothetical protein